MRIRLGLIPVALGLVAMVAVPNPTAAATPKFLVLPFPSPSHIHIQRAWWTISSPGVFNLNHHGIDYILGTQDAPSTWKSFPVYAAADGEACGALLGKRGCVDFAGEVMGDRVLIKHNVNGTIYYTWYNHLKSIVPKIPLGSRSKTVHVKQGELIGYSGATGNNPLWIHLHFELQDANNKPIDPYGIYGTSRQYPDPAGRNSIKSKAKNYWITNPPTVLGGATPTPKPSTSPSASASPGGATANPGESPAASSEPNPAASPIESAGTSGSTGAPIVDGSPAPSPDPSAVTPGSTSGADPPSSGSGLLLPALLATIVVAGVAGAVFVMRRRRGAGGWNV